MARLTPHDITFLFLSLGILLAAARFLGEIVERMHQPAILGELLAGILLGPTVLGAMFPSWEVALFPKEGARAVAMDALATVSIVLFLLVAGLEVELSTIWRQGKTAFSVSISGILIPFALGFGLAWFMPGLLGSENLDHHFIFPLFFATALSISALPVIARTLMDLNLYRTDLGMLVMAAATFDDLSGWLIFSVILGMMETGSRPEMNIGLTIGLTLLFAAFMLTAGRWLIDKSLPWIQAYTRWPGGVLGFALVLAFFGASFAEWIGIHAIFGAFLAGVAIGDSRHLRQHTRALIQQFVSFIFAPLFFAGIGLKVNFIANFDATLAVIVLVIACAGKILGCGLGAHLGGMPGREGWAVGFAMNARGAMEIILGTLALQYGVIGERMFVALVVMALATSIMGGPMIQRILQRRKVRRFNDFMKSKGFLNPLRANDRREAIAELAQAVCAGNAGMDPAQIEAVVLAREEIMPTGLGEGVALPHARIEGLAAPALALGLSRAGIDFDAPDGKPAHLIFLILTPVDDDGAQLEILAHIGRTFKETTMREKTLQVGGYTEFLALLKTETI